MPDGELDERLAAHNAAPLIKGDLLLNAYRKDVLVLPTELLNRTPGLVHELNNLLQDADLGRPMDEDERVTIDPASAVTGLRLLPGVDALGVVSDLLSKALQESAAGLSPTTAEAARRLAVDRLYEPGDPVVQDPPDPSISLLASGSKQGHGDAGRVPVTLFAAAPGWRSLSGTRPVVALLDTAVNDRHDWLSPSRRDPFCVDAATLGWRPPPQQRQTKDSYAGHGTFTAGLVRQVAPDVSVLSVQLMHDDGVVDGSTFVNALKWLHDGLVDGETSRRVDVLCIPFGYEPAASDEKHNDELKAWLKRIAEHGVRIVASAGNRGSDTKTYPAAFATEPDLPLTSVGAQNPDKRPAHYSNHGNWVTDWEIGTGVISTMPRELNGVLTRPEVPKSLFPNAIGDTLDPDSFVGGFARWSGTSFAAAVVAGRKAQEMVDTHPAGRP